MNVLLDRVWQCYRFCFCFLVVSRCGKGERRPTILAQQGHLVQGGVERRHVPLIVVMVQYYGIYWGMNPGVGGVGDPPY